MVRKPVSCVRVAAMQASLSALFEVANRWFPERQIYIRSEGRVHFYTVGCGLQATVAGLACTTWHAGGPDGPNLCFTADGVLLRVVNKFGKTVVEAVRVTYAPSNPADFVVPQDYRRVGPNEAKPQESKP